MEIICQVPTKKYGCSLIVAQSCLENGIKLLNNAREICNKAKYTSTETAIAFIIIIYLKNHMWKPIHH